MTQLARYLNPGPERTKLFTGLVFFVGALCGAYAISQLVLQGDLTSLGLIGMGFAGLAFVVKILNNWRHGLYIFFGWLFVEDFARKYLGNNMAVFFA